MGWREAEKAINDLGVLDEYAKAAEKGDRAAAARAILRGSPELQERMVRKALEQRKKDGPK